MISYTSSTCSNVAKSSSVNPSTPPCPLPSSPPVKQVPNGTSSEARCWIVTVCHHWGMVCVCVCVRVVMDLSVKPLTLGCGSHDSHWPSKDGDRQGKSSDCSLCRQSSNWLIQPSDKALNGPAIYYLHRGVGPLMNDTLILRYIYIWNTKVATIMCHLHREVFLQRDFNVASFHCYYCFTVMQEEQFCIANIPLSFLDIRNSPLWLM